MKKVLFDSHAILKWLQEEPGYDLVKSNIIGCQEKSINGYMNQINIGEVYYRSIRVVGLNRAKDFLENFLRLNIQMILPDSDLILKSAE